MKKATGITRPVDQLGRIVIPIELRRTLGLGEKDPVEIFVNGDEIILRKYAPGCTLCGNVDKPLTALYPERRICTSCVIIISNEAEKLSRSAV